MLRDTINVVLVEPQESLNIGSVARAMKNFGFSKLHLVAPRSYSQQRALITACHANDIIEGTAIWDSLEEALSSMREVIGFSRCAGHNRAHQLVLTELPTHISAASTALVFGPEDNGLSQQHAALCRYLVRIDASEGYPSFNLAHAVLLTLSELFRGKGLQSRSGNNSTRPSWNDFVQLERIVGEIAQESGFYRQGTPQPIPLLMKKLIRRMGPDEREMRVLLGFFGKVERHLRYLRDRDNQ